MIAVIGHVRFPASAGAALGEAMRRVTEASRAEDGCLLYAYGADIADPGLYRVSELWESKAALDAHMAAPHMRQWRDERAALGMMEREIAVYTVSGPEAL
jgi:quinol monooxygenase YgiN